MALQDHVATLLHSSLAEARKSKKLDKKTGQPRFEFYAKIAFPPAAGGDIMALVHETAPGTPANRVQVKPNAKWDTPVLGIPDDWLVLRAATQFAPDVYARNGKQLVQDKAAQTIKESFYPGRQVRALLSAFAWNYDGKAGVSFNLVGVMDAGDGTRMSIGTEGAAAEAFGKYADESAPDQTGTNPFGNAPTNAQNSTPAAGSSAPTGDGGNPFQQAAGNGNPFA
jgi:hypothetical protein